MLNRPWQTGVIAVDPRLKDTSLKGFSIQPAARPHRCQNPGLLSIYWTEVWGDLERGAQQTQGFALPLLAALLAAGACSSSLKER